MSDQAIPVNWHDEFLHVKAALDAAKNENIQLIEANQHWTKEDFTLRQQLTQQAATIAELKAMLFWIEEYDEGRYAWLTMKAARSSAALASIPKEKP